MSISDRLEKYIDNLRHNSERRVSTSFDTETADQIADDLEELLCSEELPEEVRLRVVDTDESGVADVSVFDCSYSAPMKEDYGVTGGAEIILTVDGGRFEVVVDE